MVFEIVVNYLLLQYLKSDILVHKDLRPNSLLSFRSPQQNEIGSLIMVADSQSTWDHHKAAITQLYAIKTLQQVMDEMKERHGFTATYDCQNSSLGYVVSSIDD